MLDFPDSPADGEQTLQPNGVTYQWNAALTRWEVVHGEAVGLNGLIGEVKTWPSNSIPGGFLSCDGSAISRATYVNLFNVIGTSWGEGDGSTTFNLPDMRGQFLRGRDDGRGLDPDAAGRTGQAGGATADNVGSEQSDQFRSHIHDVARGPTGGGSYRVSNNANTEDGRVNTSNTGGNETRPFNVYVQYIIRHGLTDNPAGLVAVESGLWTPNMQFGGDSTGFVYTAQQGTWQKIDEICHIDLYVVWSIKGSGSGTFRVGGLPFPALDFPAAGSQLSYRGSGVTFTDMIRFSTAANVSEMTGVSVTADGNSPSLSDTNVLATGDISISGHYRVAA